MTVSVAWAVALSPAKASSLILVALCFQKKDAPSIFYKVDLDLDKTFAIDYLEI